MFGETDWGGTSDSVESLSRTVFVCSAMFFISSFCWMMILKMVFRYEESFDAYTGIAIGLMISGKIFD